MFKSTLQSWQFETYTKYINRINEFETIYRKLRHEFKSKIYSYVIDEGTYCFYEAYDKGDNDCLYEFLIPRAKHELCYIDDDGEAFENSSHDDIMEHIRYSQLGCHCSKKLFINFFEKKLKNSFYTGLFRL